MKNYKYIKNLHIFNFGMKIIDIAQCHKSFHLIIFEFIEGTSQFNENFSEVDVQYTDKLHEPHNDLPFLPKKMKIEKLVANSRYKNEYII